VGQINANLIRSHLKRMALDAESAEAQYVTTDSWRRETVSVSKMVAAELVYRTL
jgi:hypothetical protein